MLDTACVAHTAACLIKIPKQPESICPTMHGARYMIRRALYCLAKLRGERCNNAFPASCGQQLQFFRFHDASLVYPARDTPIHPAGCFGVRAGGCKTTGKEAPPGGMIPPVGG